MRWKKTDEQGMKMMDQDSQDMAVVLRSIFRGD